MLKRRRMPAYQKLTLLLVVMAILILGGARIFQWIENDPAADATMTYQNALYTAVMVITGIGADTPKTANGRYFLEALALISVGLLVGLLTQVFQYISVKGMLEALHDRKVRHMKGHIIVCGTSFTLHELLNHIPMSKMWIIVKTSEEAKRLENSGVHVHVDDYTCSSAFEHAGIHEASMVIACGDSDADNAFVCLSAKHIRKDIPVISRISRTESRDKLRAAGADEIISPAELAAMAMVAAIDSRNPAFRGV